MVDTASGWTVRCAARRPANTPSQPPDRVLRSQLRGGGRRMRILEQADHGVRRDRDAGAFHRVSSRRGIGVELHRKVPWVSCESLKWLKVVHIARQANLISAWLASWSSGRSPTSLGEGGYPRPLSW